MVKIGQKFHTSVRFVTPGDRNSWFYAMRNVFILYLIT